MRISAVILLLLGVACAAHADGTPMDVAVSGTGVPGYTQVTGTFDYAPGVISFIALTATGPGLLDESFSGYEVLGTSVAQIPTGGAGYEFEMGYFIGQQVVNAPGSQYTLDLNFFVGPCGGSVEIESPPLDVDPIFTSLTSGRITPVATPEPRTLTLLLLGIPLLVLGQGMLRVMKRG